jgi:hypothetical protein
MTQKKTLLPELLPAPPVMPSAPTRQRVLQHWQKLVTGGAVATMLGCGCLVMDPLPPPAVCRTTTPLIDQVTFTVSATGTGVLLDATVEWGVTVKVSHVDGATLDGTGSPSALRQFLVPNSPTAVITVTYLAECENVPRSTLRVVLTPVSSDGGVADGGSLGPYTLSVFESPDAGP